MVVLWLAVVVSWAAGPSRAHAGEEGRHLALWITRWDYRSERDVQECFERAASLGVTDVLWQVRGQCDAFYKSDLEPWGRELFRNLPADVQEPGFDPLAIAVRAAHERGMRLHAWVNAMPLWKGTVPPENPRHPFNAHPEWRLRDGEGNVQPLNEHYVIVNPLLDAVHDHTAAVCRDIAARYAVDGIHLDYIRYVSDTMTKPAAWCTDGASLEVFRARTGREWTGSEADRRAMQALIRTRISEMVERIRREIRSARPGVQLSAAVWRRPDLGRDTYLQDGAEWVRSGLLDRAYPMIYTKSDDQFASDLGAWLAAAPGQRITPGLGIYMHAPGASRSQFAKAGDGGADGLALFAYAAMFESVDPNQDKSAPAVAERKARLEAIRAALEAKADITPPSP